MWLSVPKGGRDISPSGCRLDDGPSTSCLLPDSGQVRWERAGDVCFLFAPEETKAGGVKGVAATVKQTIMPFGPTGIYHVEVERFVWAVEFVAHDRMAKVGEVDADLVEAPGLWEKAELTDESKHGMDSGGDDFIEGQRGFARGIDASLDVDGLGPVFAQAINGRIDASHGLRRTTEAKGKVLFLDLAAHDQFAQNGCGDRVAGRQNEPGCFSVESIDQSDGFIRKTFAEPVPKRGFMIRAGGVDEERSRLLNDQKVRGMQQDLRRRHWRVRAGVDVVGAGNRSEQTGCSRGGRRRWRQLRG